MFIGHFAVALAAKSRAPKPSLGTYVVAAQFLDLLWPVLLLFGVERVEIRPGDTAVTPLNFVSYPYSHSLLTACLYALLFAGAAGATGAAFSGEDPSAQPPSPGVDTSGARSQRGSL